MRKTKRILLADDAEIYRVMLDRLLTDRGYSVTTAANGLETIKIFREDPNFDLLLVDLFMPYLDGFKAIRQIRSLKKGKNVAILAISGVYKEQDIKYLKDLNVSGFMNKNLSIEEIIWRINRTLFPQQPRRGVRIPVCFPVNYTYDKNTEESFALNISAQGMCLSAVTDAIPPTDSRIRIELNLPHNQKPLHFQGKVIWCKEFGPTSRKKFLSAIGVEFDKVSKTAQEEIGYFIEEMLCFHPASGYEIGEFDFEREKELWEIRSIK